MYTIFKRVVGDQDIEIATVATENEAKEVVEFFKHMLKDDPQDDEDYRELYYAELVLRTVADITVRLDYDFGKRNDAWFIRHNAIPFVRR